MQQTKIFDRLAEKLGRFSISQIFQELTAETEWQKDKQYLMAIINSRIDQGFIRQISNNLYEFIRINNDAKDSANHNIPILKFDAPIGATQEFKQILKSGVTKYKNPSNLVKLTNSNSRHIENLITKDDRYKCEFSKRIFDSYKLNNGNFIRNRDSYFGVLRMIDLDNSTQVWQKHREDFYRILDYIIKNEQCFYDKLQNCDITLVDDLLSVCSKDLLSFCSKICKFLNKWIFDNDGFYIYDYYVLNIIPYYLKYYKTKYPENYAQLNIDTNNLNNRNYREFYNLLSNVHTLRNIEFGDSMTKHHLDHIMWYSYRSFRQSGRKIFCQ